jgi:hypothetical protein|eukprot:COSAG01_NODE_262_length_19995_cov_33.452855_5_plen_124_part_00
MAAAASPLLALCAQVPDLGQRIFVGAGWATLPAVEATCHALREFVCTGGTWAAACEALWATKVFVPAAAQQLLKEGRGREAWAGEFFFGAKDSDAEELASSSGEDDDDDGDGDGDGDGEFELT